MTDDDLTEDQINTLRGLGLAEGAYKPAAEVRVTSETGGQTDWAWLGGFFEGEGSIVPALSKWTLMDGQGRESTKIYLYITNTDLDVLEKAQRISGGLGRLKEKHHHKNWKDHWKRVYRWEVNKRSEVDFIMERLLPHLGNRRTARWHELVAEHAEGARNAA